MYLPILINFDSTCRLHRTLHCHCFSNPCETPMHQTKHSYIGNCYLACRLVFQFALCACTHQTKELWVSKGVKNGFLLSSRNKTQFSTPKQTISSTLSNKPNVTLRYCLEQKDQNWINSCLFLTLFCTPEWCWIKNGVSWATSLMLLNLFLAIKCINPHSYKTLWVLYKWLEFLAVYAVPCSIMM